MKIRNKLAVQAVIFDMDGVIVDSEPLHLLAYQELFRPYDVEYTAQHNREFLGCKDLSMAEILVERYNLGISAETFVRNKEEILFKLILDRAIPRPGLYEILEKGKQLKLPLAVASSATVGTIELVVDTLKIRHYFQTLTSGDEVQHGKPAPDVFLLAAKRLGIAPAHCLVIEDTLNGIKAAKAAGMLCIGIPCEATMHQDHSLADMNLSSLNEIDLEQLSGKGGAEL